MFRKSVVFLLAPLVIGAAAHLFGEEPTISIVTDTQPGSAAAHGMGKIVEALRAGKIRFEQVATPEAARGTALLVAGRVEGHGPAAQVLKENDLPIPEGPEALLIRRTEWQGKPTWVLAGSDERGLMYAELDVADRIGWGTDHSAPLSEVRDAFEKPDAPQRALSLYTMNRAYWESRFYDEAYWARYLDLLAQNRFNSLVVIFGYENGGFLAPCYPYFFDTEAFPDVRMVDITREEQQKNLDALNRLIRMAHDRGIEFTVGIWDHIYRGGVQGGGVPGANESLKKPTHGLVWGVTEKNLIPYTKAALAKFVRLVPDLDAFQFRMHGESGLKKDEQEAFWCDVFRMLKETAPRLRFDARAKGLPDSVIQAGLDTGVRLRITTKYWMEQMGLPFHPTHVNPQNQHDRRHGYADMLRYPRQYKMHWRLWNGGTSRVLLWGDPEYARRFVESTHLYDGDGFEVNEPLATKMEAQPHETQPFALLNPPYRYYDYEFERYWHFFQVFGRIGYNPETPAAVWRHEFGKRFGREAGLHLEQALHRASWILPRILAACYPYKRFPMTRGWAEKQCLGDLPAYAKVEGSDVQQFANFDEEAQLLLETGETAKTRPPETARWFAQAASDIQLQLVAAETCIGDRRSKEFDVTLVDLKILAGLALFHARRIPAAVSYRLYERTKDADALDRAIAHEREAIKAWRKLVADAGDVYADDLMMGVRGADLCGHWKDELTVLGKGLGALERKRKELRPGSGARTAPQYRDAASGPGDGELPVVRHQPVVTASAGQPLTVTATVNDASGVKWVRLRYRSVNQYLDYQTLPMKPTAVEGQYRTTVPAEQIAPTYDFMYFIEAMDNAGNGTIYPDLNRETPYIVVRLAR